MKSQILASIPLLASLRAETADRGHGRAGQGRAGQEGRQRVASAASDDLDTEEYFPFFLPCLSTACWLKRHVWSSTTCLYGKRWKLRLVTRCCQRWNNMHRWCYVVICCDVWCLMWCDMMWCCNVLCGVLYFDVVVWCRVPLCCVVLWYVVSLWYGMVYGVLCGVLWCVAVGLLRYGMCMVRCIVVWYRSIGVWCVLVIVWYGVMGDVMLCCIIIAHCIARGGGVVWCDLIWCCNVWCDMLYFDVVACCDVMWCVVCGVWCCAVCLCVVNLYCDVVCDDTLCVVL
jgi:hypothetical protein